ncbi:MAG: hypothetical protein ACYS99_04420 [Planctomycetota bacterium]|jgi:hypothetical protein
MVGQGDRQRGPEGGSGAGRALELLACAAILIAPFLIALWRLPLGLDYTDEGFALAAPLRSGLGDTPFRHEIQTALLPFDVVLGPLFRWFPGLGVLDLRLLGLAIRFITALCWFLLLARYFPNRLIAALAATVAATPLVTYWEPGYDLLGYQLPLIGVGIWLHAWHLRGRGLAATVSALGGVVTSVGILTYLPTVALLALPPLVWVLVRRSPARARLRLLTTAFFSAQCLVLALAVLAVALSGLVDDFFAAAGATMGNARYSSPTKMLVKFLPRCGALLVIAVAGVAALRFLDRATSNDRGPAWLFALTQPLAVLGPYVLVEILTPGWLNTLRPTSLVLVVALTLGLYVLVRRGERSPTREELLGPTTLTSFLLLAVMFLLVGILAGKGMRKSVYFMGTGFLLSSCLYARALATTRRARSSPRLHVAVGLTLICLAVSAKLMFDMFRINQREAPASRLTTEFVHPPLRGIRSTPGRVKQLEELMEFLSPRVPPGSFLLAYEEVPLVYFVTRTRPAIDTVWARVSRYGAESRQRSVRRMIEDSRVPRYCVRSTSVRFMPARNQIPEDIEESSDPLDAFVREHYRLVFSSRGDRLLTVYEITPRAARALLGSR